MPRVNIKLCWNPQTRRRDITIDYVSDADALPIEHETDHKAIINKLIEGGLVVANEIGAIKIERDSVALPLLPNGEEESMSDAGSVKIPH